MSAAKGGRAIPVRGEAGVVMMFVLMAILLVGAITVSAIQIIGTDVLGSIKEIEADQVFNIAQAGVHYAIGQLQLSNGYAYAGGTATIADASLNTLGTATITVNCIDTGASPSPNGCTAPYAGYRRIISTGGAARGRPGPEDRRVHFGVDDKDKWNKPTPLPNGQLTVWINSSCQPPGCACMENSGAQCAGLISHATGSATIFTPNGSFLYDDSLGALNESFNGPVVANQLRLTGWNNLSVGAGTNFNYSMFNKLMSWKDQ